MERHIDFTANLLDDHDLSTQGDYNTRHDGHVSIQRWAQGAPYAAEVSVTQSINQGFESRNLICIQQCFHLALAFRFLLHSIMSLGALDAVVLQRRVHVLNK